MLLRLIPLAAAGAALTGCATMSASDDSPIAAAQMIDQAGKLVGSARLIERGGAYVLRLSVEGVPAGAHGFHLHTTGQCTTPDFQSAGGHLNPAGNEHGRLNPKGQHLGDLPNIEVPAGGRLTTNIPINGSAADLDRQLFDSDGTSVMIHAQPDDYRSDPTGGAGTRIACGVLQRG